MTHHYLKVVTWDYFFPVLHPADSRQGISCDGTFQLDVGGLGGVGVGRIVQELRRNWKNTDNGIKVSLRFA